MLYICHMKDTNLSGGTPVDAPCRAKSLVGSLDDLEGKLYTLLDVARLSDQVLGKINDPRQGNDLKVPHDDKAKAENTGDLIDLFDAVADKIHEATLRIGNNLDTINSIIG